MIGLWQDGSTCSLFAQWMQARNPESNLEVSRCAGSLSLQLSLGLLGASTPLGYVKSQPLGQVDSECSLPDDPTRSPVILLTGFGRPKTQEWEELLEFK